MERKALDRRYCFERILLRNAKISARGGFHRGGPFLFFRQHGLYNVFQLVGALHVIGIVVGREIEGASKTRAYILQLFLKTQGNALGVEGVGLGQNNGKEIFGKVVDRIARAQFPGDSLGGVAQRGFLIVQAGLRAGRGLGQDKRKSLFHGQGAAKLHGKPVPKVVLIGHGLKQIGTRLDLESDIAFEFREEMLLQLVERALAVEKVAEKEQGERAEAEEGHAERPLVPFGMNKHQWVHEESQTDGQDQNEDCGKGRKLETATFEAVEFLTIDRSHHPPASSNLPASAGPLEVAAIPIGSGLPY